MEDKSNGLRIYHSSEEAAETAEQSPIDRIRQTVRLILQEYGVTEE